MSRLGASNSSLLEQLKYFAGPAQPTAEDKARLLSYVLGHVLFNAILKYPGPILSGKALCAYMASSDCESDNLAKIFSDARYDGPFADNGQFVWRDLVDKRLEE